MLKQKRLTLFNAFSTFLIKSALLVAVTFVVLEIAIQTNLLNNPNRVYAYSTECPPSYSDQECLDYLEQQARDITNQINDLENKLNAEQYAQLSLLDKISYKQSLIQQKQAVLDQIKVGIEQNNVEINILLKDIELLQQDIDVATQEIDKIKDSLKKRVSISYKYTNLSPIEIALSSENLQALSRRMEYLQKTREKDVELLDGMSSKIALLNEEKITLAAKKLDVQTKRDQSEAEKTKLFAEKASLDSENATLQALLAESKQREREYLSLIDSSRLVQSALDKEISQILASLIDDQIFENGQYVTAGGQIGKMGSTGCSSGAHLHFSINNGTMVPGWGYFWGNVNPWSGYLTLGPDYAWQGSDGWFYYYVHSAGYVLPAKAPVVITQNHHQGMAIDLVSLQGAGAPIYAAHSGLLVKGVESVCGGKYAMVKANDGKVTIYLHIQ